jgi:hypothetical protein
MSTFLSLIWKSLLKIITGIYLTWRFIIRFFSKKYVKSLIFNFLLISLIVWLSESYLINVLRTHGFEASPFCSWEIAIIIQTFLAFLFFVYDEQTDKLISTKLRKTSIVVTTASTFVSIGLYIFIKFKIFHIHDDFLRILLVDSITFVPMLVFFTLNLTFLFWFIRNKAKRDFFIKIILFLDLPFCIPYFIVIIFASYHQVMIQSNESLISGVSTFLLLSSNLATTAFNSTSEIVLE